MQCADLTDEDLWRAIAENTQALSEVAAQRRELDAAMAASDDPTCRAKLMRLHLDTVNRYQREYRTYTAELRRRHAIGAQNAPGNPGRWTANAIRRLFSKKTGASSSQHP